MRLPDLLQASTFAHLTVWQSQVMIAKTHQLVQLNLLDSGTQFLKIRYLSDRYFKD